MKFYTFFLLVAAASILLELAQGEKICCAADYVYSFKFGKWDATIMNDGERPGLENFFATVPPSVVNRCCR